MILKAIRKRRAARRQSSQPPKNRLRIDIKHLMWYWGPEPAHPPQPPKNRLRIDIKHLMWYWGPAEESVTYGPHAGEAAYFHPPWEPLRASGAGDAYAPRVPYGMPGDTFIPTDRQLKEWRVAAVKAKKGPPKPLIPLGLKEFLMPFKLPHYVTPTDALSQEELVEEARNARPLLREFGIRDSALRHPVETNIRYLRMSHYLGKLTMKPYFIQLVLTFVTALVAGGMFTFGPTQQNEELALGKMAFFIVGFCFGLLFGTAVGYTARTMSQFWVAYGYARIAQKVLENGIRRTVAVYELPLLRLAFADRHGEQIFSGVEERSGFANGRMNLETDVELAKVTDPRVFYQPGVVRPCVSTFTGVNATRRHSLIATAKVAGTINNEKQSLRQNDGMGGWIGEHKGLTFFAISAAVSFLVLAVGVEIDLSKGASFF